MAAIALPVSLLVGQALISRPATTRSPRTAAVAPTSEQEIQTYLDANVAAVREVALPQYAHLQRYNEWRPLDVRAAYRYLQAR